MHLVERPFWAERIRTAWRKAPIAWLSGVRRVGKTTLARSFSDATYLNCDLPSTIDRLADPERYFRSLSTEQLILDEVHQLPDPSRVLKIAADEYPTLKVLATGSSTLAATNKFRDTLAGRKRLVHLVPVLIDELPLFGVRDLQRRLLHGGLPAALLEDRDLEFYSEWLDSFFARDIQELFKVEKRSNFLALVQLLLRQSGGLMEVASLARATALSRPTVMSYLDILQLTHVVTLVRPYHDGGRQELLHQPKAYGFDTGFVAWSRGWNDLRNEDCGPLWEHLVLERLQATSPTPTIHFWRNKQQREVDFVLPRGRATCDAIECKWQLNHLDGKGLRAFRADHPRGRNFVVVPEVDQPYERKLGELEVTVTGIPGLVAALRHG